MMNCMKRIISILFLLASPALMIALHAQGLIKLDDNNGFKNYKLGTRYTPSYGVKTKQDDGSDKVVVGYVTDRIGDIPVKSIELVYIRDTLATISVNVEPDYADKLVTALKNSFGDPTADSSDNEATRKLKPKKGNTGSFYTDRLIWKASRIGLEYYYFYPEYSSGGGAVKSLKLIYSLNNFSLTLSKSDNSKYSSKDF